MAQRQLTGFSIESIRMIWKYLKTYNKQSTVPAIYVKDNPLMITSIASPRCHATGFVRRALLVFALLISALPGRTADDAGAAPEMVAAPSLALSGLFPALGATGVCPDTPLRLTFSTPPALWLAGNRRSDTLNNFFSADLFKLWLEGNRKISPKPLGTSSHRFKNRCYPFRDWGLGIGRTTLKVVLLG